MELFYLWSNLWKEIIGVYSLQHLGNNFGHDTSTFMPPYKCWYFSSSVPAFGSTREVTFLSTVLQEEVVVTWVTLWLGSDVNNACFYWAHLLSCLNYDDTHDRNSHKCSESYLGKFPISCWCFLLWNSSFLCQKKLTSYVRAHPLSSICFHQPHRHGWTCLAWLPCARLYNEMHSLPSRLFQHNPSILAYQDFLPK